MSNKEENLKELLSKFYKEAEAQKVEEDILRGEQVLSENPAPKPEAAVISSIKLRVSNELAKRHRRGVAVYIRVGLAAAAAAVLIGFGLFVIESQEEKQPGGSGVVSEPAWEAEDFTVDDPQFSILAADVEAVAKEVLALRLGESGSDATSVDEVETEWLEIDSDFWKG